ncbi:MAG: pyrroloquinoline quinone-dependent dehydrogenase [Rhodospirillaceae bacterium]|nr:pyrroloquinoline quinone-dependent dehydrogenase [Rhodospirillaceae bacterium]
MTTKAFVLLTAAIAFGSVSGYAQDGGWPAYGGAPGGGHYGTSAQIDRGNVARLRPAWTHRTGDLARYQAGARAASYEVTPIYANETLYACSTFNRIIAIDPGTGNETWSFDPHAGLVSDPPQATICRGVAYWQAGDPAPGAPCQKRVFKGDRMGRMFAVDADTGMACVDFGAGGVVDLTRPEAGGTGRIVMTSPPAVVGDVLVIGGSVGDNIAADSPDGVIRALDVRSGALIWRIVTVPPELSAATGGADVWPPFSIDVDRNMAFIATGSPSVDVYGAGRTADIPYANAVLAIDAATGAVKWHRQIVRHDLFDYDLPDQPHLVDIVRDGVAIPAVVQITKMGTVFVFHRDTGAPLFPIEDRPVPASDVPGEAAAPTQPIPLKPAPFSAQTLDPEQIFGLTPWDRGKCRETLAQFRYEGPFTPPSERGSLIFPSPGGGGNWGGAAYDPARNRLIVKAQNFAFTAKLIPVPEAERRNDPNARAAPGTMSRYMEGTPYRIQGTRWLSPFGVPCNPPPWGELAAIDLASGEFVWRRTVGQVPFGPFKLLKSPAAWGSPVIGGPIVTAGGLVFMAATTDPVFRAYDIDTGVELWAAELPAPGMSVPMTYVHRGRQYVVIAAGGSILADTPLGDWLTAFALPE